MRKITDILWKMKYKRRSLAAAYCYRKGLVELPYAPLELFIEPTNFCNLKCIICLHGTGLRREKGFMSMETFDRVLKEAVKSKVLKITLHFAGEPLLNKDIFTMIRHVKKHNIYVRAHTNATILDECYSRNIINSGLDELSFSFDDYRKDVYERIRVNADYDKTLDNIRKFLEIKKSLKAKKPFLIIQQIKLNGIGYNDGHDGEFRKLFSGLPVDKFYAIYTHNWSGARQEPFIERYSDADSQKSPCRAIWYRLVAGWDGKVFACCNEMDGKLLIGDLTKTALADIWNGHPMQRLRRMMIYSQYNDIEACRNCDVLVRAKDSQMSGPKEKLAKFFLAMEKK